MKRKKSFVKPAKHFSSGNTEEKEIHLAKSKNILLIELN
jgi:hypothetical protein